MKEILVGYTGFVGSNINKNHYFDGLYNSKNIDEAFGSEPDLLVYSGVPAQKFIANKFPEEDMKVIENAINNIKKINPKKIVLISTIDVYPKPVDVDEDTNIDDSLCEPYGKNRLYLENWVRENFNEYLIVRLPGLYGENIKKNFIYDLINVIPSMLKEEKYQELINIDNYIQNYYENQNNGFYKCKKISNIEKDKLKEYFKNVGFSALNFTDSRGVYQFYNLDYLWNHIEKGLEYKIKILNLSTEPILVSELYEYICNNKFVNEITDHIPNYNYKTKYADFFNGKNGYIFNKDFLLEDIKNFINKSQSNIKFSISNIGWTKDDDELIYSYLKEIGAHGIEIAPTRIVDTLPYDNVKIAQEKVKAIKEKYGLDISSMQSIWFGKTENIFENEDNYNILLEYTKKAIDFAVSINCPNLVFGSPKNRNMSEYNKDYPIAVKFFKEIGEYAKEKNVVVAIEPNPIIYNTNFLNTTKQAIEFVKELGIDSLKVNYDLGTVIANGEDINILKNNINYINHIHISEPNLVFLEERNIHKELIDLLKELNYNKYISIEMKNMNDIERLKSVINYVKNIIEGGVKCIKI